MNGIYTVFTYHQCLMQQNCGIFSYEWLEICYNNHPHHTLLASLLSLFPEMCGLSTAQSFGCPRAETGLRWTLNFDNCFFFEWNIGKEMHWNPFSYLWKGFHISWKSQNLVCTEHFLLYLLCQMYRYILQILWMQDNIMHCQFYEIE